VLSGVLIDVDGVLVVSWDPLPGAAECLAWLRESGFRFRLVTNSSSKTRREIAESLDRVGMPVDPADISTAVTSAAEHLSAHHPGMPCLVVNEGSVDEDLVGVRQVSDPLSAGVVLLGGAGPSLVYRDLNAVFRLASEGIPVVALHRNTRYQTADGPALDMGAFIPGLEAAAGIQVPVLGKPSRLFFEAALKELGVRPAEAAMVGDDVEADVRGAQDLGVTGVLVRTGKFRARDLRGDPPPDHVIEDIGRLPELLATLDH
jgi:HAD superfamily hydrolase (TIGR01458 family)